MKSFVSKFSIFACCLLFFIASGSISSCKKDQTCHGKVTVVDSNNAHVAGATVRLDANSVGGQKVYNGLTDGSGVAVFDIDLPAIFDITATKATYPNQYGKGSLNVDEPKKESEVTVKLQY